MTVLESRIDHVTLYARGARIRRVAMINVPAGASRLVWPGLPPTVIDDSVRIEADGGAIVTGLRVALEAPPAGAAATERSPELTAATQRLALAFVERERINNALNALAAAAVIVERADDEPAPAWHAMVETRRQLIALRAEREQALREQAIVAVREYEDAERALAAVKDHEQRASSARDAKQHELRKHVELELEASAACELGLRLEYQVASARWAPSYIARLDGDRVVLELRASIVQASGEDWTDVALRLSTAEPERFDTLPELASQRIGRRQAEPARAGFRAPPAGAPALYADFLVAFGIAAQVVSAASAASEVSESALDDEITREGMPVPSALQRESWDDQTSRPKKAYSTRPGDTSSFASAPPPARAAPMQMAMVAMAPQAMPATMKKPMAPGGVGGVGSVPPSPAKSPPALRKRAPTDSMNALMSAAPDAGGGGMPSLPPPPPVPRLDYTNLRMAPPGASERGLLIAATVDVRVRLAVQLGAGAAARVDRLALPSGLRAGWAHSYDYAFTSDGRVDVQSDATWHSLAITRQSGTVKLRHVAVPREQPDVFRVATITNPLLGPLLPGPIDVYDRGTFLVTSTVDHTPAGGSVEIGLGVDAKIKLARNTEFREEAAGMLRGALRLHHMIKVDVENLSDRAIELEVRERIPVSREGDDDVEVIAGKVEPAWERWTPDPNAPRERRLRGGYRWKLGVPAGGKRSLHAAYEVKIAAKHELLGGNRRES